MGLIERGKYAGSNSGARTGQKKKERAEHIHAVVDCCLLLTVV